jgi:spore coat polysaccharide biosynthesis protein SpsF (cytidylyltransferase family)
LRKTIGIIEARMASGRLPGKILAPLADRPLLEQLHARIARSRIDEWWLVTSSDPSDDVTEAWGFELGLRVHRGRGGDVLSRFAAIGAESRADWIVRVLADHPFIDALLIDVLLDTRDSNLEAKHADLLQHRNGFGVAEEASRGAVPTLTPKLPLGYDVQLIRGAALERAARERASTPIHQRAHLTSWFAATGNVYDVPAPAGWPDRGDWRWTLETYQDLAMARSAFRLFGSAASTIEYPAMVAMLDTHPEITGMNAQLPERPIAKG